MCESSEIHIFTDSWICCFQMRISVIFIWSAANLLNKRQGCRNWNAADLCISYYCPLLCSPGPRCPSQNLICNPLWDINASQRGAVAAPCCRSSIQPDPIWEPVSNLIMFPLERTVSLDQIRSYSAASGISCPLMEWLSSFTNNPRRNNHEINVI